MDRRERDGVVPGERDDCSRHSASAPGGQNVNKVGTKVDLRVEAAAIQGLSEAARRRLHGLVAHRLDAAGRLVVTSQLPRTQSLNVEDGYAS